ncbi:MAG: methionine synthase [Phycisphaerae bacterium]|nr:methionine synthase [Phycisphaerae bacterium]
MRSEFLDLLSQRVVFLDGAMGTSVHGYDLPLSDYRNHENCTEILCQTRPDVVGEIHRRFLEVGCDAVETNSFGSNRIVLAEFGLADRTRELNRLAAEIARDACRRCGTSGHPRFAIGSMGPGTKLVSLRQTTFDILQDSYAEQIRGLMEGGVDALLFETSQDILQVKAGLAAAEQVFGECGRRVPIMVQITIETTGTMLVGTDIAAAVTTLEAYPQIEVIGLNCATGPQEMSEHIRYLSEYCTRKLSVVPNAGLPQVVGGKPVYPLTPEELARWLKEFVEADGVNLVGGCCGTTPEHLAAVVKAIGHRPPVKREPRFEPGASSLYQSIAFRQDNSFLIVGERTNANGSKKFRELLAAEDIEGMVQMARDQVRSGCHMIDVCAAYVGRDENADMSRLISRFATEVQVPLMIDSTETAVIETALKLAGGKCVVNSINLEDGEHRCAQVLPLCRKYGAAVVALTIDEEGMAKTCERKVAIARRLYDLAVSKYGMRPSDILFDPLTFTICTGNDDDRRLGLETLEAIRRIKREMPECHILLGVSNISFGVKPAVRHVLNSVFLHYAREAGLDAAIVHAAGIEPLFKIDEAFREIARKLIFDERAPGYDPLADLISRLTGERAEEQEAVARPTTVEERLKQRVIDGDRKGLETDLDEARATHQPLEIINEILLPGMKVVGDLFGSGQMQLPFVLQSAETMKAAVAHLEPHMDRTGETGKGSIVLATVKGDVHDIGKNLVDILLTNNGYTVYNLGIKQPIDAIVHAWQEKRADVIGMSGLLVKSTVVMRDNLLVLNERGVAPPVILGGAALTRKYVEQDLRPLYKGPLFYARDAFAGMDLMAKICGGRLPELMAGVRLVDTAEMSEADVEAVHLRAVAVGGVTSALETLIEVPARSGVSASVPIPKPPFWGRRVIEKVPLKAVLAYLNEVMLFQVQWDYRRKGRSQDEFDRYIDAEVRPIYRDLVARCEQEAILEPKAIYGYWPCQSEGNGLRVYDPEDRERLIARFDFPRQKRAPFWCLSDFWRPKSSGEFDVVALSIVTAGRRAGEVARQWFSEDRYRDYLHLHGLSVETAEALAEYIHKQVRMELGIAGRDAREVRRIFQQGYQGSRFSFGYPACPSLEDQAHLWPLLGPKDIGITLSEEFQLDPEQSTSAVIAHHPEARYFKA